MRYLTGAQGRTLMILRPAVNNCYLARWPLSFRHAQEAGITNPTFHWPIGPPVGSCDYRRRTRCHQRGSLMGARASSPRTRAPHHARSGRLRARRERTGKADEVLATLQQQHAEFPEEFRTLRLALTGARQGASSQLDDFAQLMERFAHAQVEHMRLESGVIAMAERVIKPSDWSAIDVAFRGNRDPLFSAGGGGLSSIMTRR